MDYVIANIGLSAIVAFAARVRRVADCLCQAGMSRVLGGAGRALLGSGTYERAALADDTVAGGGVLPGRGSGLRPEAPLLLWAGRPQGAGDPAPELLPATAPTPDAAQPKVEVAARPAAEGVRFERALSGKATAPRRPLAAPQPGAAPRRSSAAHRVLLPPRAPRWPGSARCTAADAARLGRDGLRRADQARGRRRRVRATTSRASAASTPSCSASSRSSASAASRISPG